MSLAPCFSWVSQLRQCSHQPAFSRLLKLQASRARYVRTEYPHPQPNLSACKEPGAKASGLSDPLETNRRIGMRIAARVLHSLRCDDRSCLVSNRGPIAPETNCLFVLQQPDSVVEGETPALRTRESNNQLFPTNHDPATQPEGSRARFSAARFLPAPKFPGRHQNPSEPRA